MACPPSPSPSDGFPPPIITTLAGDGTRGFRGDGGPATLAALDGPEAIAVSRDGSLYIADSGNHRVRRVGPEGGIETVAGNGEQWSSGDPNCRLGRQTCGDGGPATAATLGLVHNIDVGPDGSLYALTGAPAKIRRIGGDGIIAGWINSVEPFEFAEAFRG